MKCPRCKTGRLYGSEEWAGSLKLQVVRCQACGFFKERPAPADSVATVRRNEPVRAENREVAMAKTGTCVECGRKGLSLPAYGRCWKCYQIHKKRLASGNAETEKPKAASPAPPVARAPQEAKPELAAPEEAPLRTPFVKDLDEVLDELRGMLLAKNEAYGDAALFPVRVFSRADTVEQIRVRLDDKLSRLMRGADAGEDTELDLLGYLILLRIARGRQS